MSQFQNPSLLHALSVKCGSEVRYFELVDVKHLGVSKSLYLCVCRHGLNILKKNLSSLIPGGEIFYAHIEQIIIDTNSVTDFAICLNDNRPVEWEGDKVIFSSDSRGFLIDAILISMNADHMYRFNTVFTENMIYKPISTTPNFAPLIFPFYGYSEKVFCGFRIWLPSGFRDLTKSVETVNAMLITECVVPVTTEFKESFKISLNLTVYSPYQFTDLYVQNRGNIRYRADDLIRENSSSTTEVLNSERFVKEFNLNGDVSEWTGWQVLMKTSKGQSNNNVYTLSVFLRRCFFPPLLDSAIDMELTFRMNSEIPSNSQVKFKENSDEVLLSILTNFGRIVAGTICSVNTKFTIYKDLIQSNLDCLSFNNYETYEYIENKYNLYPSCRQKICAIFIRSLYKILLNENLLENPDILNHSFFNDIENISVEVSDPVSYLYQILPDVQTSLDLGIEDFKVVLGLAKEISGEHDKSTRYSILLNSFLYRLSTYITYVLSTCFSIDEFIKSLSKLSADGVKKVKTSLDFLLHLRPIDFRLAYQKVNLVNVFSETTALDSSYFFNAQALALYIDNMYIYHIFQQSGTDESTEILYARFLCNCLTGLDNVLFANVKTLICKQIIRHEEVFYSRHDDSRYVVILAGAVISLLLDDAIGTVLKTYAVGALVNLSINNEDVKNLIMSQLSTNTYVDLLVLNDPDLVHFVMILLVNLTKSVYYRSVLGHQLLELLCLRLQRSVGDVQSKSLPSLLSVLAHFSNDEMTRQENTIQNAVQFIVQIFQVAPKYGECQAKALFCIKQICIGNSVLKVQLGEKLIGDLIQHALEMPKTGDVASDYFRNMASLLYGFSSEPSNCVLMQKSGMTELSHEYSDDFVVIQKLTQTISSTLKKFK